ncbi:MAG: hypothetical protein WKG07_04490 [Hymenobacter sp.]
MPSQFATRFSLAPFAGLAFATFLGGCAGTSTSSAVATADRSYLVYVGTNVSGDQASTIYLYRLHAATGELRP